MKAKWTSDDVPGQQGRLAVVTGANTGLGFETAQVLAARGASVVLAVRDTEKGKRAAARIAGTAPGADVTVQPECARRARSSAMNAAPSPPFATSVGTVTAAHRDAGSGAPRIVPWRTAAS